MFINKLISIVIARLFLVRSLKTGQSSRTKIMFGASDQLWRVLSSWTIVFSVCSLISLSHEHSLFSPTLDDRDVASFRYGSYGSSHSCVTIPSNFTLCKNIGYSQMMVPNLLQHDSLQEAQFHVSSIFSNKVITKT